jgi:hypothetical protein
VETTTSACGRAGDYHGLEEVALPPLEQIPSFGFVPASPNFVARVERRLRGSRRDEPQSDGPFLGILKAGAKRWYRIAYHLLGQKREAMRWAESGAYGRQWAGHPEEQE